MKQEYNPYQKSLLNLKHKIVDLEHIAPDGSVKKFHNAEVISVDLEGNGISILADEKNYLLQGGVFRTKIIEKAPFRPHMTYGTEEAEWPVMD